jgi:hypothetical protein
LNATPTSDQVYRDRLKQQLQDELNSIYEARRRSSVNVGFRALGNSLLNNMLGEGGRMSLPEPYAPPTLQQQEAMTAVRRKLERIDDTKRVWSLWCAWSSCSYGAAG